MLIMHIGKGFFQSNNKIFYSDHELGFDHKRLLNHYFRSLAQDYMN